MARAIYQLLVIQFYKHLGLLGAKPKKCLFPNFTSRIHGECQFQESSLEVNQHLRNYMLLLLALNAIKRLNYLTSGVRISIRCD